MASSHVHPRRRAAPQTVQGHEPRSTLAPTSANGNKPLPKGDTFHGPTNAISEESGPVIDVARLANRAPTSPDALQALCTSLDKRVEDMINSIDKSFEGLGGDSSAAREPLPVPSLFLANATLKGDRTSDKSKRPHATSSSGTSSSHDHESDSGLGSSVCESNCGSPTITGEEDEQDAKASKAAIDLQTSVFTPLARALGPSRDSHYLNDKAAEKIRAHIIEPLLREDKLKDFHPLVGDLPVRIGEKKITCLRDLEKTLIFLAPRKSKSPALYLRFTETAIQCIHTTVSHLNEVDLRRPTDRPYTNTYFYDLIAQVRAYARIMAASRLKQAEGKALEKTDFKAGERLVLKGGLTEDGKPAQLVREKDGEYIPIDAGRRGLAEPTDDEISRSMARKRKADMGKIEWRACRECGKEFKRPCDLTKHEKTHSRPWKCVHTDCKYFEMGWPTEKERDRHINDKHSSAPALYKCLFEPCTYTSKRESNCKQHMEKAHGWEYVRSKSKNKVPSLLPSGAPGAASSAPTPASTTSYPQISTPATSIAESPAMTTNSINSPFTNSLFAPSPRDNDFEVSLDFSSFGYLSPESEADRRQSVGHDTNMSYESSIPSSAFTSEFDFSNLTDQNPWPAVDDVFANIYNVPDSHDGIVNQLPTPSWTDDMSLPTKETSMPPLDFGFNKGAQDQFMMSQPEASMRLTPVDEGSDSAHLSQVGLDQDFSLFGEQNTTGTNMTGSQFSNNNFGMSNSQEFSQYDGFNNMHMDQM